MFNLPFSYMSEEYGRLIGNTIGSVKEVDVQPDGRGWVSKSPNRVGFKETNILRSNYTGRSNQAMDPTKI